MLLSIVLSNLVYLLLPAVISARVITREDSADLAAFDMRSLSTPLKNLLPTEKAISLAGIPSGPDGIVLNSTNSAEDTLEFEAAINVPGVERSIYFVVSRFSSKLPKATNDGVLTLIATGQRQRRKGWLRHSRMLVTRHCRPRNRSFCWQPTSRR